MVMTLDDFKPITEEAIEAIHSLIACSTMSANHTPNAITYEICILGKKYLSMSREFIETDKGTIDVIYTISIYDEDTDYDEDLAYMTVSVNRRIFTPSEQKIIDVFNACSRRIIQQELQLLQNRITTMQSEFTHN